jgi:hypothetical protein
MNSRTLAGVFGFALIAGVARAQSTQAVEWKVSEGGNGHWYCPVASPGLSWNAAAINAQDQGGYLATLTSSGENAFVVSKFGGTTSRPWIGLFQRPDAAEPASGWEWTTGEPVTWTNWSPGEPNGDMPYDADQANIWLYGESGRPLGTWNDWTTGGPDGYLMEWSADCNNDGIVDYGQIRSGQLADDNANGVPDICETSVTGVAPPSVPSQGGSTVTIKGNNLPENPSVQIGGVPATDVVRVSATRITAVSPALLPGMVTVTVNGFTLQDALYIRPNCGSDLDQDGEVTAADISIVLLDFGPCYDDQATNFAPDVPPLLDARPLAETDIRR